MKLKIEYINEDTGRIIKVKNKGNKVFYSNSDVHDPNEFEELTDRVFKFDKPEKILIDSFYKMASELQYSE